MAAEDEGRFHPGSIVAGRYRILSMLGKGGMGEVYRAIDLTLGQSVALKFLPEDAARNERWLERFHSEVRIARQISHPNVCRVYDIGQTEGTPFISMEYIDGDDMAAMLGSIGRLPPDKALDTARKLCAGLAAAHDKGVIHRDLKPQNIMISKRGEILIMDFGLAAVADSLGGPEARNGTPAYMAPEQLRGAEVTAKSDIYALGLVLYELFTGRKPFDAKTIPALIALQESQQLSSMSSIAADIDPAVEGIVRRCLHPDPAKRPSSPLAVAAALPGGDPLAAALAAGETISPELLAASGKHEPVPLKWTLPALIVVLLALLARPFIGQAIHAINYAPVSMPPEVLAQKARDNAARLGYTDRAADSHHDLRHQYSYLAWVAKNRNLKTIDWNSQLHNEPPVYLRYRQSPDLLLAKPDGRVSENQPPRDVAGMWTMDVDSRGLLRHFEAVPPQFVAAAAASSNAKAFDPDPAFRAAGLDPAKFAEITPEWTPTSAFDSRRAWKGKHPAIPDLDLTVQVAAFQGRITDFRIVWPWTKPAVDETEVHTKRQVVFSLIAVAYRGIGLIFCVWLARRNIRQGKGDRKGAWKIAGAYFVLDLLQYPARYHFVPSVDSAGILFGNLGGTVFFSALMWLLYVALEPVVRARWPHSIVTWSRALSGQFSDPQLGSHILYGCLAGVYIAAIYLGVSGYSFWAGSDYPGGVSLDAAESTRGWISVAASVLSNGLTSGMMMMFLIFGLRQICRRDWIAAIVASAFLSTQNLSNNDGDLALLAILWLFVFGGLVYSLMRIGMVAASVGVLTANVLLNNCSNLDPLIWYSLPAYLQLLALAGIAWFGFLKSRGDHVVDPLQ
jgi:serine/threonine-protein kinase